MDTTQVKDLAISASKKPFYAELYKGLDIKTFEDIPVWDKWSMFYYGIATGEMYYGEPSDGVFITSSGHLDRPIIFHPDDAIEAFAGIAGTPAFKGVDLFDTDFIHHELHEANYIENLPFPNVGLKPNVACNPKAVAKVLNDRPYSRRCWFGIDTWLMHLARHGLFNPEDILCYVSRQYLPDHKDWYHVERHAPIYVTTEGGVIGWRSHLCDSFVNGKPAYHLYRDDLYLEIIDGELIISFNREKSFPFVRYKLGDFCEFSNIECKCGFKGQSIIFNGREEWR